MELWEKEKRECKWFQHHWWLSKTRVTNIVVWEEEKIHLFSAVQCTTPFFCGPTMSGGERASDAFFALAVGGSLHDMMIRSCPTRLSAVLDFLAWREDPD